MHKKYIFIIVLVGLVAYSNSLFNKFVGDDELLITTNNFYKSWSNVKRLFSKDYITQSHKVHYGLEHDFGSGSVAYRPVLSFTYFLDYATWKENPFGYHLRNLLLHIFNGVLVYYLIVSLAAPGKVAFWATLLFVSHPIQSEAVCNIGYRADCLSTFFCLISFLCFIHFTKYQGRRRKIVYAASLLFYFLGIFTKELSIVLPLIMLIYDFYFREIKSVPKIIASLKRNYLGFIAVSIFYVYLYLWVFPNDGFKYSSWVGDTFLKHAMVMIRIFALDLRAFLIPTGINILPPTYIPPIFPAGRIENLLSASVLILILFFVRKMFQRKSPVPFLILWFFVSFIPVSNLISLVNPMAFRFMYFPSIGFFAIMAIVLLEMAQVLSRILMKYFPHFEEIFLATIIGGCLAITVSNNALWKSNFTISSEMIRHYPKAAAAGYRVLGREYFMAGQYEEAKEILLRGIRFNPYDAELHFYLGICYMDDFEKALEQFKQAINLIPTYVAPYYEIARIYSEKVQYQNALPYLEKALALAPHVFEGYENLIQAYMALGRENDAKQAFEKAKLYTHDKKFLGHLELLVFKKSGR